MAGVGFSSSPTVSLGSVNRFESSAWKTSPKSPRTRLAVVSYEDVFCLDISVNHAFVVQRSNRFHQFPEGGAAGRASIDEL